MNLFAEPEFTLLAANSRIQQILTKIRTLLQPFQLPQPGGRLLVPAGFPETLAMAQAPAQPGARQGAELGTRLNGSVFYERLFG